MRLYFYFITALFFTMSVSPHCIGQSPSTGEIDYPHLGLKFTVPSGWGGSESEVGFVMGHDSIPGLIIISVIETQEMEELKSLGKQGFYDDYGTALKLDGEFIEYSESIIGASYSGTLEFTPASSYVIGMISSHGSGISIMAITSQEMYNSNYRALAEKVMQTVEFTAPDIASITKGWLEYLSGYRLRKMSSDYNSGYDGSYSGQSTDVILDLCSDQSFSYSDNSSFSLGAGDAGGAYGSNQGAGHGTWDVGASTGGTPILVLSFANGEVWENDISVDNEGKTFLNGSRVFRLSGEDGPACN